MSAQRSTLRSWLWLWLYVVLPITVEASQTLMSVQHTAILEDGEYNSYGAEELRIKALNTAGDDPTISYRIQSKFVHAGCMKRKYGTPLGIINQEDNNKPFDPKQCVAECLEHRNYRDLDSMLLVVGVQNDVCACWDDILHFEEADPSSCTYECKFYANPICGGEDDHYGIFMRFEYQKLSASGCYDWGRKIWYTVVMIREDRFRVEEEYVTPQDLIDLERYYLSAVDAVTGEPAFQYQVRLPGLVHNIQYDLDGSRIVGMLTSAQTGRQLNEPWVYYLISIDINSTEIGVPKPIVTMQWDEDLPEIPMEAERPEIFLNDAFAATFASLRNVYVFTVPSDAAGITRTKSRLMFIHAVESGKAAPILAQYDLDFVCLVLSFDEKSGDLTGAGHRYEEMQFVKIAIIRENTEDPDIFLNEPQSTVDITYSPFDPFLITPAMNFSNLWLHPGLNTADHLNNKSYVFTRTWPRDHYEPRFPFEKNGMLLYEAFLEFPQLLRLWCPGYDAEGFCVDFSSTLTPDIPYSGLYQREPRIPLSLPSPALISARFDVSGNRIVIEFDRSTTMGAAQVDTNGDGVPDYVEPTPPTGVPSECVEFFDDDTMTLLGNWEGDMNNVYCEWDTTSTLLIRNTLAGASIDVGDMVYLREEVIYAVPQNGEYSMASQGGKIVSAPLDPPPPGVTLVGAQGVIDACTDIAFSATEPIYTGGYPVYTWSLHSYEDQLQGRLQSNLNLTKITLTVEALEEATAENSPNISLPYDYIEAAMKYVIRLEVQSRWGTSTELFMNVTKSSQQVPTVSIDPIQNPFFSYDQVSLRATCEQSPCEPQASVLTLTWISTGTGDSFVDFEDLGIPYVTPNLVIPEYTLFAEDFEDSTTFPFTVECSYMGGDNMPVTGEASTEVVVEHSYVVVILQQEGGSIQQGHVEPLVVDARCSRDMDDPPPATDECLTFRGTFTFYCQLLPADENTAPEACYGNLPEGELPVDPLTQSLELCQTNVMQSFVRGGRTFSMPIWDPPDQPFCQWANGVLFINAATLRLEPHNITVRIEAPDGRSDAKSVQYRVTQFPVPQLTLLVTTPDTGSTVPIAVTGSIVLTAVVEDDAGAELMFSWSICKFTTNAAYLPDEAQNAADQGIPYTVPPEICVDVSAVYDYQNTSQFISSLYSPELTILPNILEAGKRWEFTVHADTGLEIGNFSRQFETAGAPPYYLGVGLTVTPINDTMESARIFTASGWDADDLPLSYQFGYYKPAEAGNPEQAFFLTSSRLTITSLTVDPYILPIGEASTDYSLAVFVRVYSKYEAMTELKILVYNLPPENQTEAVNAIIDSIETADPEEVPGLLNQLIDVADMEPGNLDEEDEEVLNQVLDEIADMLNSETVTESLVVGCMDVLNTVLSMNPTMDIVMETLALMEQLAVDSVNNELITLDPNSEGWEVFTSLLLGYGGLLDSMNYLGAEGSGSSSAAPAGASTMADMLNCQFFPTRQVQNHPVHYGGVVSSCPAVHCDADYIVCWQPSSTARKTCCPAPNPETCCDDPPCWFDGASCPESSMSSGRRLSQPKTPKPEGVAYGMQAMRTRKIERRCGRGAYKLINFAKSRAREPRLSTRARRAGTTSKGGLARRLKRSNFAGDANWTDQYRDEILSRGIPVPQQRPRLVIPARNYEEPGRRLQSVITNTSMEYGDLVQQLEEDEIPLLAAVQGIYDQIAYDEQIELYERARREMVWNSLPAAEGTFQRSAFLVAEEIAYEEGIQLERNLSQILTRSTVMRDTVVKYAITLTSPSSGPTRLATSVFTAYFGRTRNMSDVSPSFVFPDNFVVSPTAPIEGTPDNPESAFSYIIVNYNYNVYEWKPDPPGNDTLVVTLIVMKATTTDLDLNDTDIVRAFADRSVYSSGLCMQWDRFAPNTAGGAWSPQGMLNDGEGCLTTRFGDLALFVDGQRPSTLDMVTATSYYLEEVVDIGMNYMQLAVVGFLLLIGTAIALWGYIQDELVREKQARDKVRKAHHLDGDGVSKPVHLNDPIPYMRADNRNVFLAVLFWNVIMRDHSLVGPLFYHEKFTRPQRVLCFGVLVNSVLAINATIYGLHDRSLLSPGQFVASGVVSGLVAFPVYFIMVAMFELRPTQMGKTLIKRSLDMDQLNAVAKKRDELDAKSMLKAPPGYLQFPLKPGPDKSHIPGGQTLLALPPPMAKDRPPPPSLSLPPMIGAPDLPMIAPPDPDGPQPYALQPPVPGVVNRFPSKLPPINAPPGVLGLPALPKQLQLPPLPATQGLPGSQPPPPRFPPMQGNSMQGRMTLPGLPAGMTVPSPPPPPPGAPPIHGGVMAIGDVETTMRAPGNYAFDPRHRAAPPPDMATPAAAPTTPAGAAAAERGPGGGDPNPNEREAPATEAATRASPELQAEAQHQVAPPPLPKMGGPPPKIGVPTLPKLRGPPPPRQPASSADGAAGVVADGSSDPGIGEAEATEAAPHTFRNLQTEAKHRMEVPAPPPLPKLNGPPPGGVPPLPGLSGPPTGAPPSGRRTPNSHGGMTPPGGMTPGGGSSGGATPPQGPSLLPGRLDERRPSNPLRQMSSVPGTPEPGTPSMAPPKTPPNFQARPPPGAPLEVNIGPVGISNGIVHRGAPPDVVPPPFGAVSGAPPKFAPPGARSGKNQPPPPPGGSMPPPPPPPPPPPKEDDATFIRRIRLQYMERAEKEHRKVVQQELDQATPWHTPNWVQCISVVCPYIACAFTIGFEVILNLSYSLKFGDIEESHFFSACILGLVMVLVIMDVMRCALTTIYELRKYENRRRLIGGEYNVSKLKRMAEGNPQPALTLKKAPPKKPRAIAPKVPAMKVPPPPPPTGGRPSFLPPEIPSGPPGSGMLGPNGARLPVGAPPPPGRPGPGNATNSAQMGLPPLNLSGKSPAPSAPPSGRSGGRSPGIGNRGGGSLLPGRLDARPSSGVPALPPPMPPGHPGGVPQSPATSVSSVTQSLTESLKARRIAGAPPLPGPPAFGTPPGSAQVQSRTRTPGTGPVPPRPKDKPPAGSVNQMRAAARGTRGGGEP